MSMEDPDLYDVEESGEMLQDNDRADSDPSDMEVDAPEQESDNGDENGNENEENEENEENRNNREDGNENENDDDDEDDDDDDDEDEDDEDDGEEGEGESGDEEEENGQSQNDSFPNGSGASSGKNGTLGDGSNQGSGANGKSRDTQTGTSGSQTNANESNKSSSGSNSPSIIDAFAIRSQAREAVQRASQFDIVPVVAIPYANQCHSVALSEGPKWILTGGEDGFIRKYDFSASIEGKAPLTVAQKHNLMDNITKAGVIGSYWENEQPRTKSQILNENPKFRESDFTTGFASYEPKVNPVYSLDVEKNGLWCLSGLLSGGISLYTMIYNEGAIHHYFHHDRKKHAQPTLDSGHHDAVSVLRLNHDQTSFLSGSWDKTIREWDLHTGKTKSLYLGSTGQISSVQFRPMGLADLTFENSSQDNSQDGSSDVDSLFGSGEEDEESNGHDENNRSENRENTENTSPLKADDSAGSSKIVTEDKIFMTSSIDGAVSIWDARIAGSSPAIRLGVPDETPPWCMAASWSVDGDNIYVGRRNSTVEEFSLRMPHAIKSGNVSAPNVSRRLQFPKISGPVSSLSVMPNKNFLFCGSNDNIRLYNLTLYDEFTQETVASKTRATPFYVIPGHYGGVLSNLIVDDTGRFLISSSGNRGWGHSPHADVVLVYSIDTEAPQQ